MQERVQKILAKAGIASRRQAEQFIAAERVTVNGNVCTLGDSADIEVDIISLDGVPLGAPEEKVYIILNKPRGYVTTVSDEKGRRTVLDLLDCEARVYPVGRLDMDSEGLLLLTNDGALTNRLLHPSAQVDKTYLAWLQNADGRKLWALGEPMTIDGYRIRPAEVETLWMREGQAMVKIVIHEGRNRQIRKMAARCGMNVTRLRRIGEGPLTLGNLKKGEWRYLTSGEVQALNAEFE